MKRAKYICHFAGLITISLFCCNNSLAWDQATHQFLTKQAAKNSIVEMSKGNYLKNLGMISGLNEIFKWNTIKYTVTKWLQEGSILEDDNPRYNNHFHNPLMEWGSAGLDDWCLMIHTSGESSLLWAQDDNGQENTAEGSWSWQTLREYYYQALTASTDAERQIGFAKTFKGLGHQMHLIQDMAVPAHVRNDAHPLDSFIHKNRYGGLFFESWAEYNPDKVNDLIYDPSLPAVYINQDIQYGGAHLIPITQLTDINSYDGTNPPGIHSLSVGLAEYTNANFFSDDTLFAADCESGQGHYFPYPRKEDTNIQAFIDEDLLPETDTQSGDTTFHISKVNENSEKLIDHFVQPTYYTENLTPFPLYFRSYYLGERCHEDAAAFLAPRAVGYSTEIIDYFFRGEMDLVPDEDDSSIYRIENKTPEGMDGHFEIYYDTEEDERVKIWEAELSIGPNARSDQAVVFDEPDNAKEPEKYILVFRGTLGCEENAVAGLNFSRCSECWLNEQWDKDFTKWGDYILKPDDDLITYEITEEEELSVTSSITGGSITGCSTNLTLRHHLPTPAEGVEIPLSAVLAFSASGSATVTGSGSRSIFTIEIADATPGRPARNYYLVVLQDREEYIWPPGTLLVGTGEKAITLSEFLPEDFIMTRIDLHWWLHFAEPGDTSDIECHLDYITLCPSGGDDEMDQAPLSP